MNERIIEKYSPFYKRLCITSGVWLIPGIICIKKGYYKLGVITIGASINSWNYWRFPIENSIRHKIDILNASISILLWSVLAYKNNNLKILISGLCLMVYCYYMSNYCDYYNNSEKWVDWHMRFHISSSLLACLILLNDSTKMQK